jgi:hypothetical protein
MACRKQLRKPHSVNILDVFDTDILPFLNNENTVGYKIKITVTWLYLFSHFFFSFLYYILQLMQVKHSNDV